MSAKKALQIRLDEELLNEIEKIKAEKKLNTSEAISKLLSYGISDHHVKINSMIGSGAIRLVNLKSGRDVIPDVAATRDGKLIIAFTQ